MTKRLTYYILAGLVLGVLVGWVLHSAFSDGSQAGQVRVVEIAGMISIVTEVFLRLIKMIIAPLVLATLVAGIAQMGDTVALGRIGVRAVGWFIAASIVSLSLGLLLVNILQPGVGLGLLVPPNAVSGVEHSAFTVGNFITHIFPRSIVEAMGDNEILQIVVFSLFIGVAITAVGEKARPLVRGLEALVEVMLQVTNYVMRFAPVAVFAAVTASIAQNGLGMVGTFGYFIGSFYLGLAALWALLIGAAFLVIGARTRLLLRYIRDPVLIAFSTASSEAAYPRTLEALDRFGVPPRIASLVLPLGYSFNMDGSMMFMSFATLFIAQAYGIELSLTQQIAALLVLMITSKGIAGVPRASIVVIAATLPLLDIPEAGLLLILGVDHFLDMGRTATNVVGNAVASSVVARWEGTLDPLEPPEIEAPGAPSGESTESRRPPPGEETRAAARLRPEGS